jgi:hypothetical protein
MSLDPISAALDIGGKLIDRLWPDPAQRDAAKLELFKMQQSGELQQMAMVVDLDKAQIAVNNTEAQSSSLWVSGWRPAVGWVCVSACAWNWVGLPVVAVVVKLSGYDIPLSPANLSEMLPVLGGMLGLGWLRTREKIEGVAR